MQRILIIGGGFAGVWAARAAVQERNARGLDPSRLEIVLVSRDPYLTIRPRLYEPEPARLRVPLDLALGKARVSREEGEVTQVDVAARLVMVTGAGGTRRLGYDRLVLAAGSQLHRAGVPGVAAHAHSVDTYADAMALDAHLDTLAGRPPHPGRFTAVVVGGSFTGLETATELVGRLRARAGTGHEDKVRVVLVERAPVVAPELGASPRPLIERALRAQGIVVRLGTGVADVGAEGVRLDDGAWIPAATTVWAGGFRASALTAQLPVPRDALGRVEVDGTLRVLGVSHVFAAGDVARAMADATHTTLMSCQHAIPMGEVAGRNAVADLLGGARVTYRQPDYVTCLDLGGWGAIFTQGWDREVALTGFWAKTMKRMINTRLIYPPGVDATGAMERDANGGRGDGEGTRTCLSAA